MTVPFKKRKLYDRSSFWASDGGTNSQGFFNSSEKGIGDASDSCAKLQGGHFPNHMLFLIEFYGFLVFLDTYFSSVY